ncbi:hypothetical protein Cgig2_029758 [Carnegiea gigantea]|uniref:Reverse transcriptase zinc-binding domain-containing protein n=1 Tax=Carnegiea gigantea TaxID=171969 RepID=A0A9Q1GVS0_9CARY|nr:hypothetical protein Cgig2_029758 [Carnegiea gigantea]
MENSVFSSPSRKPSLPNLTAEDDRSSEESGWTEYLADFSAYNRGERDDDEDNVENSSFVIGESMVSDAGSGPEWRQRNSNSNINNNNHSLSAGVWSSFDGLPNVPKKLNFKKKRTQEISHDDSLEDTASSPVNSPKITMSFKRMDINSKNMDEHLHNHMVAIAFCVFVLKGYNMLSIFLMSGTRTSLGNGKTILFWDHSWASDALLATIATKDIPIRLQDITVAEARIPNQGWDWERLAEYLPTNILKQLESHAVVQEDENMDQHYWDGNPSERFAIKSAMSIIRNHDVQAHDKVWQIAWRIPISQWIRVFTWLALHNRIMTNFV